MDAHWMIGQLYDLSLYIYFSFLLLFYFITHQLLFKQHLFHHLKVLMKVYWNWNVLMLTFYYNKLITFGLLCFSVFFIQSGLFPLFTSITGPMNRVFANGPGDRRSIPGQVIPKSQKMVFIAALLNTQN